LAGNLLPVSHTQPHHSFFLPFRTLLSCPLVGARYIVPSSTPLPAPPCSARRSTGFSLPTSTPPTLILLFSVVRSLTSNHH